METDETKIDEAVRDLLYLTLGDDGRAQMDSTSTLCTGCTPRALAGGFDILDRAFATSEWISSSTPRLAYLGLDIPFGPRVRIMIIEQMKEVTHGFENARHDFDRR